MTQMGAYIGVNHRNQQAFSSHHQLQGGLDRLTA
jgi:hypothetical protein